MFVSLTIITAPENISELNWGNNVNILYFKPKLKILESTETSMQIDIFEL